MLLIMLFRDPRTPPLSGQSPTSLLLLVGSSSLILMAVSLDLKELLVVVFCAKTIISGTSIGFSHKFHAVTSLTVELFAIREGLLLAKEYRVEKVVLEIDAQALKAMINNAHEYVSHEMSPILEDVITLLGHN
ncbi:hypothetical protein BVRB_1g009480 [Beta vulgaris subsp. vulgaris]|nr:hypothetical protein BVRB_1g009480 [Beta vulgaris subsp. vulgaris]